MSERERRFPWPRALAYMAVLASLATTAGLLVRDILDGDWVGALTWGAVLLLGAYLLTHLVRMELDLRRHPRERAEARPDSTIPVPPSVAVHASFEQELSVTVADGETRIDVPLRAVVLLDRVKALLEERELTYRTLSNPLPELTSPSPDRRTLLVVPSVDPDLVRELEELASSES